MRRQTEPEESFEFVPLDADAVADIGGLPV
jgi:hypothetical protein